MTNDPKSDVIFRRFRRLKNGEVLDAYAYGLKGWPIKIRRGSKQR